MGRFVKGDVVVTPFPFSDLQVAKRRPALVVATFPGDDVLLCQITSQPSPIITPSRYAARILPVAGWPMTATFVRIVFLPPTPTSFCTVLGS